MYQKAYKTVSLMWYGPYLYNGIFLPVISTSTLPAGTDPARPAGSLCGESKTSVQRCNAKGRQKKETRDNYSIRTHAHCVCVCVWHGHAYTPMS